jgi:hypothetical protein
MVNRSFLIRLATREKGSRGSQRGSADTMKRRASLRLLRALRGSNAPVMKRRKTQLRHKFRPLRHKPSEKDLTHGIRARVAQIYKVSHCPTGKPNRLSQSHDRRQPAAVQRMT